MLTTHYNNPQRSLKTPLASLKETTGLKEFVLYRRLASVSVLSLFLVSLVFVFAPYIMAEANAANDVSLGATWTPTSLTLDPDYGNGSISDPNHGDVLFGNIIPSLNAGDNKGTQRVIKKTLGVISSGQYYTIFLSMNSNSNDLNLSADSNVRIPAINGSWSSPTTFADAGWGYAVPTGNSEAGTFQTPFPAPSVYSTAYDSTIGTDLKYGDDGYNAGTWAAVPSLGSAQQIWKATTNNIYGFGGEDGDQVKNHFDIYYSAMVDTDVIAGDYSNTLLYTAIASSASLDEVSTNLSRDKRFVTTGDVEALSFDLSSSATPITRDRVKVYLVPHSTIVANNYTVSQAMETAKNNGDYDECTIGQGASDFVITNLGSTLNCTLPASKTGIEGNNDGNGSYDLWLNIPSYNYNYISKYTESTVNVPSIVYAGLQSKNSTSFYITKMQEMTSSVCKNTNMWGNTLGLQARIYDPTGTNKLADGEDTVATLSANTTIGLGTFELTDTRDNKTYLVRRLADGNCWMVQDLALDLANFAGKKTQEQGALTVANTDLNSNAATTRGYWDPSETFEALPGDTTADKFQNQIGEAEKWQFLPKGIQGVVDGVHYYWGSKIADDGSPLEQPVSNARAQIPRSYNSGNDWISSADISNMQESQYRNSDSYPTALDPGTGDNANTQYVGNLYNIYALAAESVTYATANTDAEDSICSRGWRLPSSTSLYDIFTAYSIPFYDNDTIGTSTKMRSVPLSFVIPGGYNPIAGNLHIKAQSGGFWSSTVSSAGNVRVIYLARNSGLGLESTVFNKLYGLAARCVVREN